MPEEVSEPISRRRFIRDAGVASALAAEFLASPAPVFGVPRGPGPTVAVIGGGVAGLTAAHELIERGFRVTVIERNGMAGLGGKARSIPVPGTGGDGRMDLPGEHGFRIFFGFYRNLTETMRRIPFRGNSNGVWDNLVDTSQGEVLWGGGRPPFVLPYGQPTVRTLTPAVLERTLVGLLDTGGRIPPGENAYFVRRLLTFMTTSEERRIGELEYTSWFDYVGAEGKSHEYQQIWADTFTESAQAVRTKDASSRSTGLWMEQLIFTILGQGNMDGSAIRLLNAPTNEAFITPWVQHLRSLGVRFVAATASELDVRRGRIERVRIVDRHGRQSWLPATWCVCAVPWERAAELWDRSQGVYSADPFLRRTANLKNGWMVGHQLFLRESLDINRGHIVLGDSPWKLVSVEQAQFWDRDLRRDYGDGSTADIFSTCISDWKTPGILYGRAAEDCSAAEIGAEVFAQLTEHLRGARITPPNDLVRASFLDPAIHLRGGDVRTTINESPLFLNTVACRDDRPAPPTQVANMFVASDYVRTNMDVACMESASEAGRRAVNALLDSARSTASRATVATLFDPPEFRAFKQLDAQRYRHGQSHLLDAGQDLEKLRGLPVTSLG